MSQLSTGSGRQEKRARSIPSSAQAPLAVSPLEAGRLLSIGVTRVYRLMRAGELQSFRSGRSRRITMASIKKLIARQIAADSTRWQQINPRPPAKPKAASPPKRRTRTDQLELPAE